MSEREAGDDRYRRLVENAPVPMGILTEDGGIVSCNRATVEFLGAECRDAVLGRTVAALAHPEDRERVARRLRRVVEDREPTDGVEARLVGLDGEERVAAVAAAPVAHDGEPAAQVVLHDVTEHRRTRERLHEERWFVQNVIDAVDDVLYVLDEDGEMYLWNEALVERTGYTDEEIAEIDPAEFLPPEQLAAVPDLEGEIHASGDRTADLDFVTKDGERVPHELRGTTIADPETGRLYRCGIARDVTERLERERELERQRDELATLDRINELLHEITRGLLGTTSRDAVERTVCERLAGSDLYGFAWIGERELDGERVVPRVAAGEDDGYLDAVPVAIDGSGTGHESAAGREPSARTMRTGTVRAETVEPAATETWRREALDRGFRSVLAVPLHYRETVYGVLAVYATHPDAFSERVRHGFGVLGETVGFAINAIKRRQLLFADAVTELEFRVTDAEAFLTRASEAHDCRLSLDGYVGSGDRWILYLAVDGVPADRIVAAAADEPTVERARVPGDGDDGSRLELVVVESSLLHTVIPTGGQVREATVEEGVGRVVLDVPVDADVHGIVAQLDAALSSATLLARRERDRGPEQVPALGGLLDDLTDRQREALETAFRAGYFEWPRASTGEDVAEALDVTAPTFHAHLRKAERAVFDALFE